MLRLDSDGSAASLARLDLAHVKLAPYAGSVYPPCHGTALLLAALTAEAQALREQKPALCVELGCGCGAAATLLAQLLPQAHVIASDIGAAAVRAAAETGGRNGAKVQALRADLLSSFRPRTVDVAVFHIPYVPTSQEVLEESAAKADFTSTWAGGPRGLALLVRLLPIVRRVLAPAGVVYLLFYEVDEISQLLAAAGLRAVPCAMFQSPAETVYVLRCTREPGVALEEEVEVAACA